jgi:L-arabinokinase
MSSSAPIVFYISGHGFGHASRDIEIINALRAREPDLRVIVCTQAPAWLLQNSATRPVELREVECDTGLLQPDSLHLDAEASLRGAAEFYKDFDQKVVVEQDFLRACHARLVLGDIPPLAFEAAAAAGLQSVAVGNFTWDWIYEGYPEQVAEHPSLLPTIRRAYARASRALRLPMHGGFVGLEGVTRDIPLVARRSQRAPADTRRLLGLPEGLLFLLSFGGYGIRGFNPNAPDRLARYTLVITDDASGRELWPARRSLTSEVGSPSAQGSGETGRSLQGEASRAGNSNIIRISGAQLRQAGCRYQDLIRAVDIVVTKPGYGIVSECIANETTMLYTSRGRFREYDVLVAEMERYTRCEFIDNDSLLTGRWEPSVERLLATPMPAERPRIDGADVAANMIIEMLPSRT